MVALALGAFGDGKTYTFQNTETAKIMTIAAGGYLDDGYAHTAKELGRKIRIQNLMNTNED